jgi:hypothetical protein
VVSLRHVTACGLLLTLTATIDAADVKETVQISVTGGGLPHAIVIDDPTMLAGSHVFSGRFIGGPAGAPDPRLPQYKLSFDIQTLHGVKRAAYVVYYVEDPATERGYIYLPGEHDAEYRANISTILRSGVDGTWRHASAAWAASLNEVLPDD